MHDIRIEKEKKMENNTHNLQSVVDFLDEVQTQGLRSLTQDQQAFLDDNNIELVVAYLTEHDFYFVLPSEQEVNPYIDDEDLNDITASKADCVECVGTVGTLGCGGTLGTATGFTISSLSTAGTAVGTASTAKI